jgi:hypothetical protein
MESFLESSGKGDILANLIDGFMQVEVADVGKRVSNFHGGRCDGVSSF